MDENKKEEEKVTIRHTINAEEAFTLGKDIYDIRSVIKNVYNNRALIGRRLNLISLSVSLVFTLLYVAYIFATGLMKKLSLGSGIALYVLLGVYAAVFLTLFIITMCSIGATAKNIKKFNRVMSYFRYAVKILSLVISVVALVLAAGGGEYSAQHMAVDVVLIILSILCIFVQAIPLLFGSLGKLARWLLSPVKIKYRFSTVALEWYELAVTTGGESKSVKKVAKKYYDEIGVCLDNFLIPSLGKKYVSAIKPVQILNVADEAAEDKPLVEGILKNIFSYATECGYVTFDPCKDLNFEGSIEEEEKQPKTFKSRLAGMGKKIGMSMLNKYIDKNSGNEK